MKNRVCSVIIDGGSCTNTVKYRQHVSYLYDIIIELHRYYLFSKHGLKSEYHQFQIKEKDNLKITFETKPGLYNWLVVIFGLTSAYSTIMILMKHILHVIILKFDYIYFDDVLVYELMRYLKMMLELLRKDKLFENFKIFIICSDKLLFPGYVISFEGIAIDKEIKVIQDWQTPYLVSQKRRTLAHYNEKFSGVALMLMHHT